MRYRLSLSTSANRAMGDFLEFYNNKVNGVGNPIIARRFLKELERGFERIGASAESYNFCENEKLRQRGIRKIHLRRYKCKVLYHIDGDGVIVDLICHDSQDYENMF